MDYYIVSLKHTSPSHLLVTFWRPDNRGYCWPLPWAGKYSEAIVADGAAYYDDGYSSIAVPCDDVDAIAVPAPRGLVDGDTGPVVMQDDMMELRCFAKAARKRRAVAEADRAEGLRAQVARDNR